MVINSYSINLRNKIRILGLIYDFVENLWSNDYVCFRLFADILNDFAICLEILAPSFGDYFTPVICVAGVCKVRPIFKDSTGEYTDL